MASFLASSTVCHQLCVIRQYAAHMYFSVQLSRPTSQVVEVKLDMYLRQGYQINNMMVPSVKCVQ